MAIQKEHGLARNENPLVQPSSKNPPTWWKRGAGPGPEPQCLLGQLTQAMFEVGGSTGGTRNAQ
jgi:hypothetical protein